MAKAVLIMDDMPDYCNDCYAMYMSLSGIFCRAAEESLPAKAERPDWCPLRELPEKKETVHSQECYTNSYFTDEMNAGWNACLNKILKTDGMRKE